MKKALIKEGRIFEVRSDTFTVHPDFEWFDVPDDTTERDSWVNGQVVKEIPTPDIPVRITAEQLLAAMVKKGGIPSREEVLAEKVVESQGDIKGVLSP